MITATWGLLLNCTCLLIMGATNCGPDSILVGSVSMDVSAPHQVIERFRQVQKTKITDLPITGRMIEIENFLL